MIVSMTGFGQALGEKNGERFSITLKSVNHRYFETVFHLPAGLDYLESLFRSRIQKKIKRGRINISIAHINESAEVAVLNEELLAKYFAALEKMRKKLQLANGINITSLVSLPGVLSYKKEELKSIVRERLIKKAFDEALGKLVDMKSKEGVALEKDLTQHASSISSNVAEIKKRVQSNIEDNKKSLAPENLESILRSTDVSEELARIEYHIKSLLKQMKTRGPKGKVLDFIGQELQREVNTLGAKVQDKHVAFLVVLAKDLIEKIREQVQNVE